MRLPLRRCPTRVLRRVRFAFLSPRRDMYLEAPPRRPLSAIFDARPYAIVYLVVSSFVHENRDSYEIEAK